MIPTFANLPSPIITAISSVLAQQEAGAWVARAAKLHDRYMERDQKKGYIQDITDALAYLALRVPATYASTYGALHAVKEMLPDWKPRSLLDIGSGPGTAVWATKELYPELTSATCLEGEATLFGLGRNIEAAMDVQVYSDWQLQDLRRGIVRGSYDLVIIANVLNELSPSEGEKVLGQAFNACTGILLIIEPGTPFGSGIVSSVAKKLSKASVLLAPYVGNSLVQTADQWLHFGQRFIRPDFSRRIRQHMRESPLMASDWEEAKYSYVAISKIAPEAYPWGRVVGQTKVQKGFLELPVLTAEKIETIRVMKRDKEKYGLAKNLKWGELIQTAL